MLSAELLRAEFSPVRTERLALRAVDPGDAEAVFAIHGNPDAYRFHPAGVTRRIEEAPRRPRSWPAGSCRRSP